MKDLAVPALSGIGGMVIGGAAVWAALQSRDVALASNRVAEDALELARTVERRENEREQQSERDRYQEQLVNAVATAVTELVAYGNSVEPSVTRGEEEDQLRASTLARLILASSVANHDDRPVMDAAYSVFGDATRNPQWQVRQSVSGWVATDLASSLGRREPMEDVVDRLNGRIDEEEASWRERRSRRAREATTSIERDPE